MTNTRFSVGRSVKIDTAATNKLAQREVFHESLPPVMVGTVTCTVNRIEGKMVWIKWSDYTSNGKTRWYRWTRRYYASVLVEAQK